MNRQTGSGDPKTEAAGGGAGPAAPEAGLVYAVELWGMQRSRLERVLGRADSVEVANAIYEAAVRDHPCRLVVLRRGSELVRSTG